MKTLLTTLFAFCCFYGIAQPPTTKITEVEVSDVNSNGQVYTIVEQMPEFPGGDAALMKFLSKQIKYPDLAKDCGCSGTVLVSFIIDDEGTVLKPSVIRGPAPCEVVTYNKDGSTTSTEITKEPCTSAGKLMEDESLRVIKSMPKWTPGKQNGKFVKVQYTLPIKFTLR